MAVTSNPVFKPAYLFLQSGERFSGFVPSWYEGTTDGEVVFTTGMAGYPESLTDPSYCGQILCFTYPLMGNYGVADASTWESPKIQARAAIMHEVLLTPEHHSQAEALLEWLEAEQIPVLLGVDTRALTKVLSEHGVVLGAISSQAKAPKHFDDPNKEHLVKQVSCKKVTTYGNGPLKIIAVDCGIKMNIIRELLKFPVTVKRVPFDYDYTQEDYDGLFLSNGPGDPALCVETIRILQQALQYKPEIPVFGICLGSQILGLAIHAQTYKLPFGHRGQNQPVIDTRTQKAYLTSQNHGYAVDANTLPQGWQISFRHLNDDTVAGISDELGLHSAVQFHPEACPGPEDPNFLFAQFIERIRTAK